ARSHPAPGPYRYRRCWCARAPAAPRPARDRSGPEASDLPPAARRAAPPRLPRRADRRPTSSSCFALYRPSLKKRPMWDRLLTNCNLATMDPAVPGAFGAIEDGAIGIQDGRIVRVGRRIDLAGYRAARVEPLGGAWVTPGLIDCHTHLVFGG